MVQVTNRIVLALVFTLTLLFVTRATADPSDHAKQYKERAAEARASLAKMKTRVVGGEALEPGDTPAEEHRRAASTIEEARGTDAAKGWAKAKIGKRVRRYYRPDVKGVAYLEYTVDPDGFVIVPVGRHDFPVSAWSGEGESPGAILEKIAEEKGERVVKIYRLDVLAYAAENAKGKLVATFGEQPSKIVHSGGGSAGGGDGTPKQKIDDDAQAEGLEHSISERGAQSGPSLEPWSSWEALKAGYAESYGRMTEALVEDAAEDWGVEDDIGSTGEGISSGQVITIPLLHPESKVKTAGGGKFAKVEKVERDGLPPVVRIEVGELPGKRENFSVVVTRPGAAAKTFKYFVEPDGGVKTRGDWSSWRLWIAHGLDDHQRLYDQFSYGGCYSGCGATAWAMLFGWADYRAHKGDGRWSHRWGLYRRDGGYGSNAAAPKYNDTGIRNVQKEIRNRMGTFCIGSSGATYPWAMKRAAGYLSGRTGARLVTEYNSSGIPGPRRRDEVRDSIKVHRAPAIMGSGWLKHYPLAYAYRYRTRTRYFGVTTDTERQFYVNQGWGGRGNGWIPARTWFSGRLYP